MPTPYLHHELFEPNKVIEVQEHSNSLGKYLVIDNFYQRPDDIEYMLETSWSQMWKYKPGSRNTIDYHDCRLTIPYNMTRHVREFESQKLIWNMVQQKLNYTIKQAVQNYDFNLFKWINIPEHNIQSYPHQDDAGKQTMIASVIYLNKDKDCNGGTAFYEEDNLNEFVGHMEDDNIQVDISQHYTLIDVVKASFNKCVIYPGWWVHGAYIDDHSFYSGNRRRKNQVYFFELAGF